MKPSYITLAIPYVNADPHIGHILEYVQGDAIARFQRLKGRDVYFQFGSDENSLKNVQAAEKAGTPVDEFVAEHAKRFIALKELLCLSIDNFIRTTEARHIDGSVKLWDMCKDGDMYKKKYKGKYCVGCEVFYAEEDLVEGKCQEHPQKELEVVEEENYFFRLSNYQKQLDDIIENDIVKITPQFRKNEILAFIRRGLEDFSISRSFERAHGWGIPVPGDDKQIMYVWFDALANYITALDFAGDQALYKKYWIQEGSSRDVLHVIGKGISRFHAIYWLGMLLSANIPLPTEEFIHGYITVNGQKISKSLGNVIDPYTVIEKYGTDPIRFYLLGAIPSYQDGDFSEEKFETFYTAHLANGIGNLVSRTLTMIEKYTDSKIPKKAEDIFDTRAFWKTFEQELESYQFDKAIGCINRFVALMDEKISKDTPWEKFKKGEDISDILYQLTEGIRHVGLALLPIIPESSAKILGLLGIDTEEIQTLGVEKEWGGINSGTEIEKGKPLFPRYS